MSVSWLGHAGQRPGLAPSLPPPPQALLWVPGTQNQTGASHTSCSHREWRLPSTNMGREEGGWHTPMLQPLSKYLGENRPGSSHLTCIHFMVNGKPKHFICLLFQARRGWFPYVLPKASAAISCFAVSWCSTRMVNLDFSAGHAMPPSQRGRIPSNPSRRNGMKAALCLEKTPSPLSL